MIYRKLVKRGSTGSREGHKTHLVADEVASRAEVLRKGQGVGIAVHYEAASLALMTKDEM